MTRSVDFPAAARAVCTEIWGRPTAQYATHWRFGSRQSKSLHLESGRITDFEADWKGGVLDALQQYGGCADRAAAWRWLEARGLAPPWDPGDSTPPPEPGAWTAAKTLPDRERKPAPPPFHEVDLPRLDYVAIPRRSGASAEPVGGITKCERPEGAAWPSGCRWLRNWWGGDSVMVPLATPDAWLADGGLSAAAVKGIHAVHVARDGSPRQHRNLNKRSWNNKRSGTAAGCGFLAGQPVCDGTLALCEGVADALAIHWHRGIPALAACGSLAGLAARANELAQLTRLAAEPDPANLAGPGHQGQCPNRPEGRSRRRAGPASGLARGRNTGRTHYDHAVRPAGPRPVRLDCRHPSPHTKTKGESSMKDLNGARALLTGAIRGRAPGRGRRGPPEAGGTGTSRRNGMRHRRSWSGWTTRTWTSRR